MSITYRCTRCGALNGTEHDEWCPLSGKLHYELSWDGHAESPFKIIDTHDRFSDDYRLRRGVVESFEPSKYGGTSAARQAAEAKLLELNDPLGHIAMEKAKDWEKYSEVYREPNIWKFGRDCYADGFRAGFNYAQGK